MTKETPNIHSTWLILRQPANFKPFFEGLCEYLKQNLCKQKIGDYEYYTCGHDHFRWDPQWDPFKHLRIYCWKARYNFHEVKDFIEEHIERKIICECQIVTDEKEVKRMRLRAAFGVDLGNRAEGIWTWFEKSSQWEFQRSSLHRSPPHLINPLSYSRNQDLQLFQPQLKQKTQVIVRLEQLFDLLHQAFLRHSRHPPQIQVYHALSIYKLMKWQQVTYPLSAQAAINPKAGKEVAY